jgi:hypothetical protein
MDDRFRCGIIRLHKERRGLKDGLRFAALTFHGVGSGKLPISVWVRAKLTRIQFTHLPDSRTAGSTGNG